MVYDRLLAGRVLRGRLDRLTARRTAVEHKNRACLFRARPMSFKLAGLLELEASRKLNLTFTEQRAIRTGRGAK